MKNGLLYIIVFLLLLHPVFLSAQQVLYSPYVSNSATSSLQVIGRTGNFYWIQKSKKDSRQHKSADHRVIDKDFSFELYDLRTNYVKTIPATIADTLLKEYLVAGDAYFDQLLFINTHHKTSILRNRYTPEGNLVAHKDTLAEFPGNMQRNDFLLARSQDRTKIVLLGFEPVIDSPPRLHALVYNSDWKILSKRIYKDPNLTQPLIQYDFINYPIEHFDNYPLKLSNNGDWLMMTASRRNSNYLLFHFLNSGSTFIYTEIKMSPGIKVQSLSLSLDNDKGEACAGILLNTSNPSIKKTRVTHYLLSQCRLDFDTTYRFSSLAANKKREENLFEQYFIPIPGKGFLFLKEYGRPALSTYSNEEVVKDEEEDTSRSSFPAPYSFNKNDYTRYRNLSGSRSNYDRGDLSLYFFPAVKGDTCWSGIINKEQTGELNSSYLSYAFLPLEGKLIFLYNSLLYNDNKYSTTTILDEKGNALSEGIVFWKAANVLDFQKARQLSSRELAVPYQRNGLTGFCIIRL